MNELSVNRHAIQSMLHHAITSQPSDCCGILAGTETAITIAKPLTRIPTESKEQEYTGREKISEIVELWAKSGHEWCGVYFSCSSFQTGPGAIQLQPDTLKPFLKLIQSDPLSHGRLIEIAVTLDIKGRLEARAFRHIKTGLTEIPLIMQEEICKT